MNCWTQSEKNIYVAAHRGWSEKYPENTMLAFRKAAELGVDQIEIDIRVTKDGQLVVIHDDTVDRVSNGTGKVCDFTLEELLQLDVGIKKAPEFAGIRIPTFVEFLEFVKDLPDMTVDFEIKEYNREGPLNEYYAELCDRTLALIEEYGLTDRCVINSFGANVHQYIQQKYGNRYRHHVYYPESCMRALSRDPYTYGYCCCVFDKEKASFDRIRSYGVQPWAGASVKDNETVDWAIEMGAVLITCNNPDVVMDLLRQKGRHQ